MRKPYTHSACAWEVVSAQDSTVVTVSRIVGGSSSNHGGCYSCNITSSNDSMVLLVCECWPLAALQIFVLLLPCSERRQCLITLHVILFLGLLLSTLLLPALGLGRQTSVGPVSWALLQTAFVLSWANGRWKPEAKGLGTGGLGFFPRSSPSLHLCPPPEVTALGRWSFFLDSALTGLLLPCFFRLYLKPQVVVTIFHSFSCFN